MVRDTGARVRGRAALWCHEPRTDSDHADRRALDACGLAQSAKQPALGNYGSCSLSNGAAAQEQNLTEAVIGDACFQGRDDVPMALHKNSKNFVGSGRDGDRGQDKIELVPSPLSTVQGEMSRDKGTPCPRLENPPPVFARFRTGLIGLGTDALPRAHIAD